MQKKRQRCKTATHLTLFILDFCVTARYFLPQRRQRLCVLFYLQHFVPQYFTYLTSPLTTAPNTSSDVTESLFNFPKIKTPHSILHLLFFFLHRQQITTTSRPDAIAHDHLSPSSKMPGLFLSPALLPPPP